MFAWVLQRKLCGWNHRGGSQSWKCPAELETGLDLEAPSLLLAGRRLPRRDRRFSVLDFALSTYEARLDLRQSDTEISRCFQAA